MAFGLPNSGGGDIMPFIKYNAKSGRIYRVDRVQDASGWVTNEVDITNNFSAVFDLENILVGWVYFGPNGPQRAMSVFGKEPTPPRPADVDDKGKLLFKGGFKLNIALAKECGGGIREFGASANTVLPAIEALYDAFAKAPERQQGKAPVVKLADVQSEKSNYGTNYKPVFQITGWVDRPPALSAIAAADTAPQNGNGHTATAPATKPAATPPATGSTQVAAPVAAPAQAAAPVAAGDFG